MSPVTAWPVEELSILTFRALKSRLLVTCLPLGLSECSKFPPVWWPMGLSLWSSVLGVDSRNPLRVASLQAQRVLEIQDISASVSISPTSAESSDSPHIWLKMTALATRGFTQTIDQQGPVDLLTPFPRREAVHPRLGCAFTSSPFISLLSSKDRQARRVEMQPPASRLRCRAQKGEQG